MTAGRSGLVRAGPCGTGASGYETGAGQNERVHYPEFSAARRPKPATTADQDDGPRGSAFGYFSTFGRSLPGPVGAALLSNRQLRGSFVCPDAAERCPEGVQKHGARLARTRRPVAHQRARPTGRSTRSTRDVGQIATPYPRYPGAETRLGWAEEVRTWSGGGRRTGWPAEGPEDVGALGAGCGSRRNVARSRPGEMCGGASAHTAGSDVTSRSAGAP